MTVDIKSAPATGSLPGRVFAIVEETPGSVKAIYEFALDSGGEKLTLAHVVPVADEDVDEEIPESVRESLTASGYSVTDTLERRADGGVDERIETIRLALQSAKGASSRGRDQHIKVALGEAVDLRASSVGGAATLQGILVEVLLANAEEVPYYVNRALSVVDDIGEKLSESTSSSHTPTADVQEAGEEPPASVRWVDDERGILEVELTRPVIEWMELEAEAGDSDSLADWVRTQLWIRLTKDLRENHGFDTEFDVDVPHDFARRASLWWRDRQIRGDPEDADLEAFLFNHVGFSPNWTIDGEPWTITEEGDDVN
ncbi:MAG: hypothetical protein ACOCY1_04440 [Halovenus sp.]